MFERLETFAWNHRLDRTSVINLALVSFFRMIEQRDAEGRGCTLEDLASMLADDEASSPAPQEDFKA